MLGTAVAAMRIAQVFIVRRGHNVDEGSHRRIVDQRQIVPLLAVLRAERNRLGVAGPQQRAAARALIIGTVSAL
jgi:hypothetical protein